MKKKKKSYINKDLKSLQDILNPKTTFEFSRR